VTKKAPPAIEDWEVLSVQKVVDGDTVDLLVRRDIGQVDQFAISATGIIRCRLVHLDTPERGEPGHDEAMDDLEDWLSEFDKSVDGGLRVVTQGKDSFGRYLSDVYAAYDRADTASDFMVREANNGAGWPVWIST
jgi:endonuclease YncB( thermonuclease family)